MIKISTFHRLKREKKTAEMSNDSAERGCKCLFLKANPLLSCMFMNNIFESIDSKYMYDEFEKSNLIFFEYKQ